MDETVLNVMSYSDSDAIENYFGCSALFRYWKTKNSLCPASGTPSLKW
jgi:hypothetical protein